MPLLDQIVIATDAARAPGDTWNLTEASWDQLPVSGLPTQTKFALLISVLLTAEEASEEHEVKLLLRDPDGDSIGGMNAIVGAAQQHQLDALEEDELARVETVLVATGVVFAAFGQHALEILWDGVALRHPMRINVLQADAD